MKWKDNPMPEKKKVTLTPDEDAMYNELIRAGPRKISYEELNEACIACNLPYDRGMKAMIGLSVKGYFSVRKIK